MEAGKKLLRAATFFLLAAVKQIPGLGMIVEVWDSAIQNAQIWEQEQKIDSMKDRIEQLEQAGKIHFQEAREIAQETIEDLNKKKQVVPKEKAQAIVDIISVMPANILQKTSCALTAFQKHGSSQYLTLALGKEASLEDRHNFYMGLIPARRPRWQSKTEFEDRRGWQFDELLGMGGFGEVWKIRHKSLSKYQAVKFCLDEKSSRILKREEHIIATLPDHKNIVNVLDSNIEKEPYWISFEYIEGGTLEKYILNYQNNMPLEEVLRLMREICEGVACAHRLSLVHRDLKPSNILIASGSVPKISDFGLSKILMKSNQSTPNPTLQMSLRQYGTWAWMSPEQREGEVADPSDDVYSLAVLCYQMLIGNPCKEPPRYYRRELERLTPPVPKDLLACISDCLELPRGERPQNAEILLDRLEDISPEEKSKFIATKSTPKAPIEEEAIYSLFSRFKEQQQELLHLLQIAQTVFQKMQMKTRLETLETIIERVQSNSFKIMVMGESMRGKSTLINALLGEEILPASFTTIIHEIKWGEDKKAVIHFLNPLPESLPKKLPPKSIEHIRKYKGNNIPPMEIAVHEIGEYAIVSDLEQIPYEKIEIFWPLPFCKDGVEIIDSPGLNVDRIRSRITTSYFLKVDAVIFVMKCSNLGSESEMDVIEWNIRSCGYEEIFFIANGFDAIRTKEKEHVMAYAKNKLGKRTKLEPGVYFLSALNALEGKIENNEEKIQGSGILDFEKALQKFLLIERGTVKLLVPSKNLRHIIRQTREEFPEQRRILKRYMDNANKQKSEEIEHKINGLNILEHELDVIDSELCKLIFDIADRYKAKM